MVEGIKRFKRIQQERSNEGIKDDGSEDELFEPRHCQVTSFHRFPVLPSKHLEVLRTPHRTTRRTSCRRWGFGSQRKAEPPEDHSAL